MKDDFNIVIVGVGGQGQITLLRLLIEAASFEGYDLKTSELHGLSQRGGSVEVQIRIGNKVFSPLVNQADADFVLGLELQESLRALYYSSSTTKFLINKYLLPIPDQQPIPEEDIFKKIKEFTKNIQIVEASEICKKELGNEILAGIFLISLASFKNLIPLNPNSIQEAIKKIIPDKYLESNLKAFNLAITKSSQF